MQVHLRIYGQVQGVFFRSYAKGVADRLGLAGWVKNREDGSVEALAEGPKGNLEEFIKWCQVGPSSAKVENIEADWQEVEQRFESFEII